MPYIETKTSISLTEAQKSELKRELATAIELIPGKSEEWLMIGVDDTMYMAFRGDDKNPAAMVTVEILGKASATAYDALTAKICEIIERVAGVPTDRVYVKYRECDKWGYNGINF